MAALAAAMAAKVDLDMLPEGGEEVVVVACRGEGERERITEGGKREAQVSREYNTDRINVNKCSIIDSNNKVKIIK